MSNPVGRPCTVCSSPHLGAVNAALRDGEKTAVLVERYGLSKGSLLRHRDNHLLSRPESTATRVSSPAEPKSDDPLKIMRYSVLAALRHAREAETSGDRTTSLRALRQVSETLTAAAKVKAAEPPAYDPLRDEILSALRDRIALTLRGFPEAAAAVAADFQAITGR